MNTEFSFATKKKTFLTTGAVWLPQHIFYNFLKLDAAFLKVPYGVGRCSFTTFKTKYFLFFFKVIILLSLDIYTEKISATSAAAS